MASRGRPSITHRVVDAGIDVLAQDVLDGVSASAFARRAGCSTGAIYSSWRNMDDFARHLWTVVWPSTAERLDAVLDGDAEAGPAGRVERAAINLILTGRHGALGTSPRDDVTAWLGRRGSARFAHRSVLLAVHWGSILLGDYLPTDGMSWPTVMSRLGPRGADDVIRAGPPRRWLPVDPDTATASTPLDRVLELVADAIGTHGVDHATIDVIARHTGLTRTAVYHYAPSIEQLREAAIERTLQVRVDTDAARLIGAFGAPDQSTRLADIVMSSLAPERSRWRQLRMEAQVSARRSAHIGDLVGRPIAATADLAITRFGLPAAAVPVLRRNMRMIQALYPGLYLQHESLGLDLRHRAVADQLALVLERLQVDLLRAASPAPPPRRAGR